jgi:oligopeptide/dipeptide ABC transporter ATP-binding protein
MDTQEASAPLLSVDSLRRHFPMRAGLFGRNRSYIHAVDGISFEINKNETLALVGESGCGKSTTGRCILQLEKVDRGIIRFYGEDLGRATRARMRSLRAEIQMIFQDPSAALTSHMSIGQQIAEPLRNLLCISSGAEVDQKVGDLLETVGLRPSDAKRFPHEFSGGQKQRVCIARALATEPSLVVCDEAVSALDVSIKAQIVNLLIDIQERMGVGYLFISHDLGIVECISHRVAVMYLGKIVEIGPTTRIFDQPLHPYTMALLAAAPVPDVALRNRERIRLVGDVPSAASPPSGCRFRSRCPMATELCAQEEPKLIQRSAGHYLACHHK